MGQYAPWSMHRSLQSERLLIEGGGAQETCMNTGNSGHRDVCVYTVNIPLISMPAVSGRRFPVGTGQILYISNGVIYLECMEIRLIISRNKISLLWKCIMFFHCFFLGNPYNQGIANQHPYCPKLPKLERFPPSLIPLPL